MFLGRQSVFRGFLLSLCVLPNPREKPGMGVLPLKVVNKPNHCNLFHCRSLTAISRKSKGVLQGCAIKVTRTFDFFHRHLFR